MTKNTPIPHKPAAESGVVTDHGPYFDADLMQLSPRQAQAVVRLMEAAPQVRRRYQFFVWSQNQLHPLLQHQVLVCGAYARQRKELVFDVFNSVVLSPGLLAALTNGSGALLRAIAAAWVDGHGRPLQLDLRLLQGDALSEGALLTDGHGVRKVLVHGVSRPQRPAEIESLFVFAGTPEEVGADDAARHVELLLPHLHSTWQRVCAVEAEVPQLSAARLLQARAQLGGARPIVTERECQILSWVRDGKNNQQIGEVLGISPLTVKNHIQKILRKLGAANRAQAVAMAMESRLLDGKAPAGPIGQPGVPARSQ